MVKTYSQMLQSRMWKAKRVQVIFRDRNKCRICNDTKNLQVHHKQYHTCKVTGKKKNPWDYQLKYLVTLCSDCHAHGHQEFQIPIFKV